MDFYHGWPLLRAGELSNGEEPEEEKYFPHKKSGNGALREFSLKKKDKLLNSQDYNNLRIRGKKIENQEFILIYKKNVLKNSRLGITVSKKVGYAVKRNRIKRITREFFRTNRFLFPLNGVDFNIIAKKSAALKTNCDLFKSLRNVAEKIDTKIGD